jgi:hypothetical protein
MGENEASEQTSEEELPVWCVIRAEPFANDEELRAAEWPKGEEQIAEWAIETIRATEQEDTASAAADASAGAGRQATLSNAKGELREVGEGCVRLVGFYADAVVRSNTAIVLFLTDDCTAGPAHAIIPATAVRAGLGAWSGRAMSARFIVPGENNLPHS